MQMLQRHKKFSGVEPAAILIEFSFPLKMIEKLSAIDWAVRVRNATMYLWRGTLTERHNQIKFIWILKGELEWNDERTVDEG